MKNIKNFLLGIIIGGGVILPGVSGAVLAVIFGLYDKIITAISHFFTDIKENTYFLLPIGCGLLIGIFLFGNLLNFVFDNYPVSAKFVFMGLILGGLPVLYKKIESHIYLGPFFIALIIGLVLFILEKQNLDINFTYYLNNSFKGYFLLFLTGIIYVSGKIIPGISSSFLLMIIGMYNYYLNIISNFFTLSLKEYYNIIPILIGIMGGAFVLIKLIEYLFLKYQDLTYSIILGFVVGSISILYTPLTFTMESALNIVLVLIVFLISYTFAIKMS
ncbi:MAG: DUF368 domain-containing protein [Bacilli bacterium]